MKLLFLALVMALVSCAHHPAETALPTGWRAPSITVPDQNGTRINLRQATAGRWAVVFFYPEADTPG